MSLNKLYLTIREPINAFTHLTGVLLSIMGLTALILKAINLNNPYYIVGSIIYGSSLILLYSASTLYHWIKGGEKIQGLLRKIDHTMIYILIAGTYTPLCLNTLKGRLGLGLLISVWALALIGIITTLIWIHAPRWLYTGFYLLLGWIGILFIWPIFNALEFTGFLIFLLGGLFYTLGAVIYGKKNEILNFKGFGFHEIFHLFILIGSIFHFIMVNNYILI